MPFKYTVTITSVGTSSVIVIPKPIIDGHGLKKGMKLDMFASDEEIRIPLTPTTMKEQKKGRRTTER